MANPKLNILPVDTYDPNTIGFADISIYPVGFNVSNAYFEITPPGYPKVSLTFTPTGVNIYDSTNLITDTVDSFALPDGIYNIKFSVNPNNINVIERSIMRVENIKCKFENIFLSVSLDCDCGSEAIKKNKHQLEQIRLFIRGAVAAANESDCTTAYLLYRKADSMLNKLKPCDC